VFLAAVPAMGLLLAAGPALLPEFRSEQAGRLDPASVALSLVAVFLLVYGIKQLAVGSASAGPAVALVAGAATGFAFVRRPLRRPAPAAPGDCAPVPRRAVTLVLPD
jgi:DHA2 family multidrug resistance protein-like MFS transporter